MVALCLCLFPPLVLVIPKDKSPKERVLRSEITTLVFSCGGVNNIYSPKIGHQLQTSFIEIVSLLGLLKHWACWG